MKSFVAGRVPVTPEEFVELAIGTPLDLWLGVEGETSEERAAREAAARDILADDPSIADRTALFALMASGCILPDPLVLAPARPAVPARRRPRGKQVAA
jgi:hypothetical protein